MSITVTHQPLHAIVYYHNPCPDGIAGAWCSWNYYEGFRHSVEYQGCRPEEEITAKLLKRKGTGDLKNVTIYFIDILPTRDIPGLCAAAKQVVIMDHHKTNSEYINTVWNTPTCQNLTVVFDLERSGAQIAWDYFNPGTERPWFIDYIGDRDLWAWKLPNSRAINSGLQNQGYLDSLGDFYTFWRTNKDTEPEIVMKQLADCGKAIETYQARIIEQAKKNAVSIAYILEDGSEPYVWAGTINQDLVSELGNILAERELPCGEMPFFSVIYSYDIIKDEYKLSLRSSDKNPNAADVSAIAKRLDSNGGGHKHAAGCKISREMFWVYFGSLERKPF